MLVQDTCGEYLASHFLAARHGRSAKVGTAAMRRVPPPLTGRDTTTRMTNMTAHVAQIAQSSIPALTALIGRQVHRVYAPSLDVAGTHVAAPSFSITISDQIGDAWMHRFVNVEATWFETPRFLNDYWELLPSVDQVPTGITINAENAMVSPCSVSFHENGASMIARIEIYTLSVSDVEDDSESVRYDRALLFVRENSSSFCVACQLNGPGIAEFVRLSEDPKVIQDFLENCVLRLTLT